jgi:hypothetical protein
MAAVTWNEVLCLPPWPSLHAIAPCAIPLKLPLMKVSSDQYIVVTSHDRELREDNPRSPFVTSVIWAPSDDAALRCGLHEVLRDPDTVRGAAPPTALTQLADVPTYAAITEAGRRRGDGDYFEHAEYQTLPTGKAKFVHKVVEVGRIGYCFLSASRRQAELPYAIRVSLVV